MIVSPMYGDTSFLITENKVKNIFIGNSWYVSSSYMLSKSHKFDLNIGRTYGHEFCGGAGCAYSMQTWGVGISTAKNENGTNYLGSIFTEFSIYYFFPYTLGTRVEYLYDFKNNKNFFKPSLGFSLFNFDIFYGYTFNGKGENPFKHGITLRIKNYHKRKNWETQYYSDN